MGFELKADVNRVELNVPEKDETIVLTSEAKEPLYATTATELDAFDLHPGLKRAERKAK